jgi:hypothetical protein
MTNILRRIEILEKEIGGTCTVPEKERIIVVKFPNGDEEEFERLKDEGIAKLKAKYGPNISEDDLLIVGIRKFYRKQPAPYMQSGKGDLGGLNQPLPG